MGILHLYGTLRTGLPPQNEKLVEEMKSAPLKLTSKLTMWKSWIGFNATHSIGALFIGLMNFYYLLKIYLERCLSHFKSILGGKVLFIY